MVMRLRDLALLLAVVVGAAEDEEGRATLLLHKKLNPPAGHSVNKPINVTLTVYNKGAPAKLRAHAPHPRVRLPRTRAARRARGGGTKVSICMCRPGQRVQPDGQ